MLCLLATTAIGLGRVANAQEPSPDLCKGSLPYQADPGEVSRFRQGCTIQRLIIERSDAENRATALEVEAAVQASHAQALLAAQEPTAEFWKRYAEGTAAMKDQLDEANQKIQELTDALAKKTAETAKFTPALASSLNAACRWRGVWNAPTARLCQRWQNE